MSIEDLKLATEIDETNFNNWLSLGAAYEAELRLTDAANAYARALIIRPTSPEALRGLALMHFHTGAYDTALPLLMTAVRLSPIDPYLWSTVGTTLEINNFNTEALKAYEASQELDRNNVQMAINIARMKFKTLEITSAIALVESLHNNFTDYPEIIIIGINCLIATGRIAEATKLVNEALLIHDNNSDVLSASGFVALANSNTSLGKHYFSKAIIITPEHYEAHIGMGNTALSETNNLDAKKYFLAAAEINPTCETAFVGLASIALTEYNMVDLHKYIRVGLSISPNHADLLFFSGCAKITEGKLEDALLLFNRVIAINEFHQGAHFQCAKIQIHQHEFDAARASLYNVINIDLNTKYATLAKDVLTREHLI